MDIGFFHYILATIATFVGAILGTIFGGASFIIQPALLLLGVTPHMAVANDIAAAAFSSLCFALYSLRQHKVDTQVVCWMGPALGVGATIGSLALSRIPDSVTGWIVFVICLAGFAYTLAKINKPAPQVAFSGRTFDHWQVLAVITGIGLGVYDGISGAGSGLLVTTTLTILFQNDMKSTLVMSSILSTISLTVAGITFWSLGLLDARLMLVMVPASMVAGIGAAKIMQLVPEKNLRVAYACIIGVLITYLAWHQL